MSDTSPSLVLLNTDQAVVGDPTRARTIFGLGSEHSKVDRMNLYLDGGGYEPSPEESSLAPFYQAASRRVFAIELCSHNSTFVMKTETLLRLAQERRGRDLSWEQWKAHTVKLGDSRPEWVSGAQMFSTRIVPQNEDTWLEVYDFSPRASKTCVVTGRGGIIRQVVRPCMREHYLPWSSSTINFLNGGHDSIAAVTVNAPLRSSRSDIILNSVSCGRCPRVGKIGPWVRCMY